MSKKNRFTQVDLLPNDIERGIFNNVAIREISTKEVEVHPVQLESFDISFKKHNFGKSSRSMMDKFDSSLKLLLSSQNSLS